MKKHWVVSGLAGVVLSSFATAAELPQWQMDGSSNSVLSFTHGSDSVRNTTEFNIGTHAYYFLDPRIEVGTYFFFGVVSPEDSKSATSIRVVPQVVYNFSDRPLSSFFVRGGAGIYFLNSASSHSYTTLGFTGSVGKHFPISSSVTWTPEFGVSGHTRGTSDDGYFWAASTEYSLTLFQFSAFF